MRTHHNRLLTATVLSFLLGAGALLAQQPAPEFSARDIFESAKGLFGSSAKKPATSAAASKPRQQASTSSPALFGRAKSQPVRTSASANKRPSNPPTPPASSQQPKQPRQPTRQNPPAAVDVGNTDGSNRYGAEIVKLSSSGGVEVTQPVLGLRYSIEKAVTGGWQEVSPTAEFRNGDTIRIVVETSEPAYLYIVNKGTSGSWNALFPSKDNLDTNHRIDAGEVRTFPSSQGFTFYGDAGEEKLHIVASRRPQEDLEGLIYRLGDGATEGEPREPQSSSSTLMASNFGDAFSQRADDQLEKMRSRDLFVETIDEPIATGNTNQVAKAVYVVNVSSDDDSQVIAEVPLIHR